MSKDRATTEPGGCECHECGCIFIGGPEHNVCGDCYAALPLIQPAQGGAVDTFDIEDAELWVACNCHLPDVEKTLFAAIAALRAQPSAAPALPEVTDYDCGTANDAYMAVIADPVKNTGDAMRAALESYRARLSTAQGVPGWRVTRFTGTSPRADDRWEIYDPKGNGGVVGTDEINSDVVWSLLDAMSAPEAP